MTTFPVSKVEASPGKFEKTQHKLALKRLMQSDSEAMALPGVEVIQPLGFHALVEAAHHSYAQHVPLRLTPDYIWVTVLQGFARHINQNPEQYRSKFVSHQGKQELAIYRPDFHVGSPNNDWPSCFDDFSRELRTRIGDKTHDLLINKFTTTGNVSTAVQQVALMDVVQSYFSYVVFTECGIPSVTLEGTPEDWDAIARKARALQEFEGLDFWLNDLIPILDQFCAAARNNPDNGFWQDLYKTRSEGSGSEVADGWLLKLLPYTKTWDGFERNPLLNGSSKPIELTQIPTALSMVPFKFDANDYQLVGGLTAVVQDKDGCLRPAFGWAVRPLKKAG
ncbi:MAG TPA: DUF4419 domain-containing protein [Planktothrix sp.]|jgi:hypothetical protein